MTKNNAAVVALTVKQIAPNIDNVVDLPSDSSSAAIQKLLELIAEIRRGDVIGVSVVKTMSNLDVTSHRILEI